MRGRAVVLVTLGLVFGCLAGCIAPSSPPRGFPAAPPPTDPVTAQPPTDGAHDYAVRLWRDFPASRVPRPLLYGWSPNSPSYFDTDAGMRAAAGLFELAVTPPDPPATETVQLPSGPVPVPTLPAQAALAQLPTGVADRSGPALRVTGAELTTGRFETDGGTVTLPAWRFGSPGLPGPLLLPAVPRDVLWPWPQVPLSSERHVYLPYRHARVSADGTVLTVILLRPKGPCSGQPTYRHDPVVTEDASAVVVGMVRVLVDPQPEVPPGTPCDASLAWAGDEHLVRLATPLGGRVLVSEDGWPLTLTPTSG